MINIHDLLADGLDCIEFKTKDEWDSYIIQFRPYRGYYNPQPVDMYPSSFPCLMIYCGYRIIGNPNGNDEFMNFFLTDGNYSITMED